MPLSPLDDLWVTYRSHEPLPLPEPAPFDATSALARLVKAWKPDKYRGAWQWGRVALAPSLTPAEARFWTVAMWTPLPTSKELAQFDPQQAGAAFLAQSATLTPPAFHALAERYLQDNWRSPVQAELLWPLCHWLTFPELLDFLLVLMDSSRQPYRHDRITLAAALGFRRYCGPYLTEADRAWAREKLRPLLAALVWPPLVVHYDKFLPLYLAAWVGMPDEMLACTQAWPPEHFRRWPGLQLPVTCVLGLGSAALVASEMQRLQLRPPTPDLLRGWLAHTGPAGLEVAYQSMLQPAASGVTAEALFAAFAAADFPELTPYMLQLIQAGHVAKGAREWLEQHPVLAMPALVPLAVPKGDTAELARDFLRKYQQQGHTDLLAQQLATLSPEAAAALQAALAPTVQRPVLDDTTTPAWLKAALDNKKELAKTQKLQWANPVLLPPIIVGDHQLTIPHVWAVLTALRQCDLAQPFAPFLQALKQHATPDSLERFVLALFDLWLQDGGPIKEKWALFAVGALGGDTAALALTKHALAWPKAGQAKRALFALACLRAIGTDTALMQLNVIVQQTSTSKLAKQARAALTQVAAAQGLTEDQLQDRIVPDAGFDAQGRRVLDYGPRQFTVVLPPDLKPVLRDPAGKVRGTLPAPNAKDDAEKAAQAQADWKLLKKQIQQAARVQADRLEQALVTDRRWSVADFETHIVQHPLLQHLARLVVWMIYPAAPSTPSTSSGDGPPLTCRVTEDKTYADEQDNALTLPPGAEIGVAHPAALAPATVRAWQQLFADYELVPPFPQLTRSVYTLTAEEQTTTAITRFTGQTVQLIIAQAMLKNMGWQRAPGMIGPTQFIKFFPRANVTAVLEWKHGYVAALGSALTYQPTYFITGYPPDQATLADATPVPLHAIPPIPLSEVLRDLTGLASKAQ